MNYRAEHRCSGTVSVIVVIDPARYFTAVYNMTVVQPEGGTIAVDRTAGAAGDVVTVTGQAENAEYMLKSVLVDGKEIVGTSFPVRGNHTITAVFGPKCEHVEVTDPGREATCTQPGLTEGKHCSECGKVLAEQQTIPERGHTTVVDREVAPTYTTTGLTEGAHCSVCSTVLIEQQIVPKLDCKVSADTVSNGAVRLDKSSYAYGETATVTVQPDAGYMLDSIKVSNAELTEGENGTYTFVVNSEHVVTAAFGKTCSVTAGEHPFGSVTVSREQAVEGSAVLVTVEPDEGFIFYRLYVDGVDVTAGVSDGNYTLTLTGDHAITADFAAVPAAGDVFYSPQDRIFAGDVFQGYVANSATLPVGEKIFVYSPNGNRSGYTARHFLEADGDGNLQDIWGAWSSVGTKYRFAYHDIIKAMDAAAGTITLGNPVNGKHASKASCNYSSGYTGEEGKYKDDGYFYESCGTSSRAYELVAKQKFDDTLTIVDLRAAVTSGEVAPVTTVAQVKALCDAENAIVDAYAPNGAKSTSGTLSLLVVLDPKPNFVPNGMIAVEQPTNGTVTVDPAYGAVDTVITVTAAPTEGYELEAIYVDGVAIEGNTFTVTGEQTLTPASGSVLRCPTAPLPFPFETGTGR